jgi:TolA-binding protein
MQMIRKTVDKYYRITRNHIIVALAFILLTLLFLSYANEQAKITDILIKRSNSQTTQIQQLEKEVRDLNVETARLENVVAYQHSVIKEMSSQPKKVEYITVEQPKQENTKHTESPVFEPLEAPSLTTTIVATLVGIGGTIKMMIPAIP